MAAQEDIRKYLEPVMFWINRQLADKKKTAEEKKKLTLFGEFIKEQLPNENSRYTAR